MPERTVSAARFRHCQPISLPKSLPLDGTWEKPTLRANDPSGYADDPSEATHANEKGSRSARLPMSQDERPGAKQGSLALREDRQPSGTPAGIQRSKRPDIMLMGAFRWFLHDFTPCCSSQLSDTVEGAE